MSNDIIPGDKAVIGIRDGTIISTIKGQDYPINLGCKGTCHAIIELINELVQKEESMSGQGALPGQLRSGVVSSSNGLIACNFYLTKSSVPMTLKFGSEPLSKKPRAFVPAALPTRAHANNEFIFSPA